jgi:FkbH-like protein
MSLAEINPTPHRARPALRVAIAASFTAQPLEDALAFWMEQLALPATIEFAPYGQVYQQLLDPGSLLSRNRRGVNVILLRPEDWLRALPESAVSDQEHIEETLEKNVADFIKAARAASARSEVPLVLVLCPASQTGRAARLDRTYEELARALSELPGLSVVAQRDFDLYPVADYCDQRRDRLGHVPYTPEFFAALATLLARRIHAHLAPAHKVVVLDCDNTLWQGIVGEDGVDGIAIPPAFMALQRFLVELSERGFLLCLCSKNAGADVLQVFEQRSDMILRKEHLVSWRINWLPKGENIRSLARELNLGLDSFVLLDDNPLECAEVELACPDVLALRVPGGGDLEEFLRHLWAFDRTRVTAEDRQRTAMYQQEAERARLQRTAPTLSDFLAGLALEVVIAPPSPEQMSRVAQLTQRTNQFNFTTVRRTEGEIRRLDESGLQCRVIEVRDRFGDYGLVGVMIFGARNEALVVDTFLLSCRVLGRGVEHRMLRELGAIARQRGLARVMATVLFTKQNQPAQEFLERVARDQGVEIEGGIQYELPAQAAAALIHRPETERSSDPADRASAETVVKQTVSGEGLDSLKSRRYTRIASELALPRQVLAAVRADAVRKMRLASASSFVAPRTGLESALVEIWRDVLRVAPIGVRDDFFDLGGTSLLSVDLCAQIDQRMGKAIPLTSIMEAPTIEALAERIATEVAGESLVLIRPGAGRLPIFFIHDGDGETLLYRNLALRLDRRHAVYGLQPYSLERAPLAHTRIPDMAAHFIAKIRTVQPRGPYLVGGMCAGGVIAFEMARQLRALGEHVAVVALLDAADPSTAPRAWKSTQERLYRSIGVFRETPSTSSMRHALIIASELFKKARNFTVYVVRDHSQRVWDRIRLRLFRAFLQRGQRPPNFIGTVSVRTAYLFAERHYRPEAPFDGELVLFRATLGTDIDEPYVQRYEDPLLGWGPRATGGVHAVDVPGGHSSMLREPYVDVLAEQLQSVIDEALGEESQPRPSAARIACDTEAIA